jgi:hypothetical protein
VNAKKINNEAKMEDLTNTRVLGSFGNHNIYLRFLNIRQEGPTPELV